MMQTNNLKAEHHSLSNIIEVDEQYLEREQMQFLLEKKHKKILKLENNEVLLKEKIEILSERLAQEIEDNERSVYIMKETIKKILLIMKKIAPTQNISFQQELNSSQGYQFCEEDLHDMQSEESINILDTMENRIRGTLSKFENLCQQLIENKNKIPAKLQTQEDALSQFSKNYDLLVLQKEKLQKLLNINEKQKFQFIKTVYNVLPKSTNSKLEAMSSMKLVQHIKKLSYRLKEVESQKKKMGILMKQRFEQEEKKYSQMLLMVKSIKKSNSQILQ